jgi:hypothetical protein
MALRLNSGVTSSLVRRAAHSGQCGTSRAARNASLESTRNRPLGQLDVRDDPIRPIGGQHAIHILAGAAGE